MEERGTPLPQEVMLTFFLCFGVWYYFENKAQISGIGYPKKTIDHKPLGQYLI
jgi:hypothetical protein